LLPEDWDGVPPLLNQADDDEDEGQNEKRDQEDEQ
jgi:hypothetical protein